MHISIVLISLVGICGAILAPTIYVPTHIPVEEVTPGTAYEIPYWLGAFISTTNMPSDWILPLTYTNEGSTPIGTTLVIQNLGPQNITLFSTPPETIQGETTFVILPTFTVMLLSGPDWIVTSGTIVINAAVEHLDAQTITTGALTVSDVAIIKNINDGMIRDVTRYGAIGDCITDDSAAFNAAIAVGPGSIYIPPRCYAIGSTINMLSKVTLFGDGIPGWELADRVTGFPTLSWIGAANGTVVSLSPDPGNMSEVLISSNVRGFAVQCNKLAGVGFDWSSVWNSIADVYAEECNIAAFRTGVTSPLRAHTDVRFVQFTLTARQVNATSGPVLDIGGDASALAFPGDTALCTFVLDFVIGPTNGIAVGSSDHNVFINVATAPIGATPGYCMHFKASNVSGNVARKNIVLSLACGNARQIYFEGTENGLTFPSFDNQVWYSQVFIVPLIGTNTTYKFCDDTGTCGPEGVYNMALGDTFGVAREARDYMETLSSKPAIVITSGASQQVIYANSDFSKLWHQNLDNSNGNMRLGSDTNSSSNLYITNPVSSRVPTVIAPAACQDKCIADATSESLRLCSAASDNIRLANCIGDEWLIGVLADGSLRFVHSNGTNTTAVAAGLFRFTNAITALNGITITGNSAADSCTCTTLSALSSSATEGFLVLPAWPGTPTGIATPSNLGSIPCGWDTTANRFWCYESATWYPMDTSFTVDQMRYLRAPTAAALQTCDPYDSIASGAIACGTIVAAVTRSKTAQSLATLQFETGATAPVGVTLMYAGVWSATGVLLYQSDDMSASITAANTIVTVTFPSAVVLTADTTYLLGLVEVGGTCTGFYGISRASSMLNGFSNNYGTSNLAWTETGYVSGTLPSLSTAGTFIPYVRFMT